MTRSEAIAKHIAHRIVRNTRKRWPTLHADAIEETQAMSTPTSSTLNGDGKGQGRAPIQTSADPSAATAGQKLRDGDKTGAQYACTSQVNVGQIKPVDRRTLQGSYPGDSRAKAAPAVLPNQPGPREGMGQVPLSGRTPAAPAPESFLGAEGSDRN